MCARLWAHHTTESSMIEVCLSCWKLFHSFFHFVFFEYIFDIIFFFVFCTWPHTKSECLINGEPHNLFVCENCNFLFPYVGCLFGSDVLSYSSETRFKWLSWGSAVPPWPQVTCTYIRAVNTPGNPGRRTLAISSEYTWPPYGGRFGSCTRNCPHIWPRPRYLCAVYGLTKFNDGTKLRKVDDKRSNY